MKKLILFFAVLSYLHSCTYDKAELLYPKPSSNCDTSGVVSYSLKVVPILQTNCYSCHTPINQSGGIVLSTYATAQTIGLNGKLFGAISHAAGYKAMPQSANKLSSCEIATLKKWIDAKCPNN